MNTETDKVVVPEYHSPEKYSGVFTVKKRKGGDRLIVATPFLFGKWAKTPAERCNLRSEVMGARAASANPFWKDLVVRLTPISGSLAVARRWKPVTSSDIGPLSELTDHYLGRAIGGPLIPIATSLNATQVIRDIAPKRYREELIRLVGTAGVPFTGMHGDFHPYNFVRGRSGELLLTDWEHFDSDGSFAFDFMNFFLSQQRWQTGENFLEFLTNLTTSAAAIAHAAQQLRAPQNALLIYYTVMRLEIMFCRLGRSPADIGKKRYLQYLRVMDKLCAES